MKPFRTESGAALPIIGDLPWLIFDPLGFLTEIGHGGGDLAFFRIGPKPAVLVNSPQLIDRVVRDTAFERSGQTRRAMGAFLGQGVFSLEGAAHMRHRKLMQPAFHKRRIEGYGEIMTREVHAALNGWQPSTTRDVREDMTRLTLAIVSRSLFDSDTSGEAAAVDRCMRQILPQVALLFRLTLALPDWFPVRHAKSTRDAIRELQSVVHRLVVRRRAEGGDRGDLLSMLISARDESGGSLSDADVCAEALTIMVAGHETTSNAMCWAVHLLLQHPDVQARAAEDVRLAVGERPVSSADVHGLASIDQIVRETMRLYPPAWWGDRICACDATVGNRTISAGTLVVFSTYVTHRDPRFFPLPNSFDPERFSPGRVQTIPPSAYLPFGAGVHMCIGNAFAMLEARLVLAAILQRFCLKPTLGHHPRPNPVVTLGMKDPFPVRVERRDRPVREKNDRAAAHLSDP